MARIVKLIKVKKQIQMLVGSTKTNHDLVSFPEPIQRKLEEVAEVTCVCESALPTPSSLRLATDPELEADRVARNRQTASRPAPPHRGTDWRGGAQPTDRRVGAGGRTSAVLARQSDQPSNFTSNPYNFAEWEGDEPWLDDDVNSATHDRWHKGRLSGVLTVELTAMGPVFIPAGTTERPNPDVPPAQLEPQRFWSCGTASGNPRYAIPGSSMKGILRTLFEIWTNSRLTIVSASEISKKDSYLLPIPYRRRCANGWVVVANENGRVQVRPCKELRFVQLESGDEAGNRPWPDKVQALAEARRNLSKHPGFADATKTGWQAVPWRANLLWTSSHEHKSKHLVLKIASGNPVNVSRVALTRFRKSLEHRAYEEHPKRVADIKSSGLGTDFYSNISAEKLVERRTELAQLEAGTVIFGMTDPGGSLVCFGHNTHFIWPASQSPRDLVKGFWPRELADNAEGKAQPDLSFDRTETAFGFPGQFGRDTQAAKPTFGTAPFRGRIRCGTFWLESDHPPSKAPVQLGPLTGPTGVKLKARPVYLPPGEDGLTETYDEANCLRGRKLYWHQPLRTATEQQKRESAPQLARRIHPMPSGAVFKGEIHFDNLTKVELGALCAAVAPHLFFGDEAFGIKVGKGKPHGLGSVKASDLKLSLRPIDRPMDLWTFDAAPLRPDADALSSSVSEFREWIEKRAGGASADRVGFVQDLKRLLSLSRLTAPHLHYHNQPGEYGWMPSWGDLDGDEIKKKVENRFRFRPIAMPRARDL